MELPPALVVLDLDGTLLSSARTISPRNLAALQTCREANVELCIASARGPATIAMTVPPILRDTVWIVHNGAEAVKEGRRIHFRPLLPEARSHLRALRSGSHVCSSAVTSFHKPPSYLCPLRWQPTSGV